MSRTTDRDYERVLEEAERRGWRMVADGILEKVVHIYECRVSLSRFDLSTNLTARHPFFRNVRRLAHPREVFDPAQLAKEAKDAAKG